MWEGFVRSVRDCNGNAPHIHQNTAPDLPDLVNRDQRAAQALILDFEHLALGSPQEGILSNKINARIVTNPARGLCPKMDHKGSAPLAPFVPPVPGPLPGSA